MRSVMSVIKIQPPLTRLVFNTACATAVPLPAVANYNDSCPIVASVARGKIGYDVDTRERLAPSCIK